MTNHEPLEVLELDDIEVVAEIEELEEQTCRVRRPRHRAARQRRERRAVTGKFPPAMSDAALAELVEQCTAELCRRGHQAYVY